MFAIHWKDAKLLQNFDKDLVLYRQPIVSRHNLKPKRYEVLVRFANPEYAIPTGKFIEQLEQSEAIALLDLWTFTKMSQYLQVTKDKSHYSVNLSPLSLEGEMGQYLAYSIWDGLKNCQIGAANLGFELTERGQINWKPENGHINSLLRYLKSEGFHVALDDFGEGHTISDLICKISPTSIKIDGAIIQKVRADDRYQLLVTSLIHCAHAFDTEVVAEWVEDYETAKLLNQMECDWLQGWAIGKEEPLPIPLPTLTCTF